MSLKLNKNDNGGGKNHEHLKERLSLHVKRRLQETADRKPAGTSKCSPTKKLKNLKHQHKEHQQIHTTSYNNNTIYDGLSDNEPDGNNTCQDTKEKLTTPDILTIVLNHRKNSLLKDPDVIQFLESVTTK